MWNEFSVGWKRIIFSILVKYFNSEKPICLGSFGEGDDSISFLLLFFSPPKRLIQSFKSSIPCTHPPPSVISVLTKRGGKQSKRTEGKNWVTSCIWAASPSQQQSPSQLFGCSGAGRPSRLISVQMIPTPSMNEQLGAEVGHMPPQRRCSAVRGPRRGWGTSSPWGWQEDGAPRWLGTLPPSAHRK